VSRQNPLIETWKEKFHRAFKHHPNRDEIMERILSDEPVSTNQIDKWWREADDCADAASERA
jgi:hypothetical protein